MHDWGWGWGGGMLFGPLFMIAGPVLLIVLLVLLTTWLTGRREGSARVRSAREILDKRFAKGEIQREEYEKRRKALGA
jgi:putative membrane protein